MFGPQQPFNQQNSFSGTFPVGGQGQAMGMGGGQAMGGGRHTGLIGMGQLAAENPNPVTQTQTAGHPKADTTGVMSAFNKLGEALDSAKRRRLLRVVDVRDVRKQAADVVKSAAVTGWIGHIARPRTPRNVAKATGTAKTAADGGSNCGLNGLCFRPSSTLAPLGRATTTFTFSASKYGPAREKRSAQDNSAIQRSSVGESHGLSYQHKPDHYLNGPDAWASVTGYLHHGNRMTEEPDLEAGKHRGVEKSSSLLGDVFSNFMRQTRRTTLKRADDLGSVGGPTGGFNLGGMTPADVYQNTQQQEMQAMQAQMPPPPAGAAPPQPGMPPQPGAQMIPQDPNGGGGQPIPPPQGMPAGAPPMGGMLPPQQGAPGQSPVPGVGSDQNMQSIGALAAEPDGGNADVTAASMMKQSGLNEYQAGFFSYCLQQGMNAGQIKTAVDNAHAQFGDDASAELYAGIEKLAGVPVPSPGMLTKTLAWGANLYNKSKPLVAAAPAAAKNWVSNNGMGNTLQYGKGVGQQLGKTLTNHSTGATLGGLAGGSVGASAGYNSAPEDASTANKLFRGAVGAVGGGALGAAGGAGLARGMHNIVPGVMKSQTLGGGVTGGFLGAGIDELGEQTGMYHTGNAGAMLGAGVGMGLRNPWVSKMIQPGRAGLPGMTGLMGGGGGGVITRNAPGVAEALRGGQKFVTGMGTQGLGTGGKIAKNTLQYGAPALALGAAGVGAGMNAFNSNVRHQSAEGVKGLITSPEGQAFLGNQVKQMTGKTPEELKGLLNGGTAGMNILGQLGNIPDQILGMFMSPQQLAGMNPIMKWMMLLGGGSMLGGMLSGNHTMTGLGGAALAGGALMGGFPGLMGGGGGQEAPQQQEAPMSPAGGGESPYVPPTRPQARNEWQAQQQQQQQQQQRPGMANQ